MKYYHLDVFTNKPFSGNGLTVFIDTKSLNKSLMQTITQEMRQFESIFLDQVDRTTFRAFIFTMEEELDFAGHPVIGAAALLHDLYSNDKSHADWTIKLNAKTVAVSTTKFDGFYSARMNQGKAEFLTQLTNEQEKEILSYLNLTVSDKSDDLPFQVVSTGLPYLILPIKNKSLKKVRVAIPDLEIKLASIGAKFFFVLDTETLQGRTWDNLGSVEDIATGSAAGPAGAYLVKNNLAKKDTEIILSQGSFLNRPSELKVTVNSQDEIFVEGDVCKIAVGELLQKISY